MTYKPAGFQLTHLLQGVYDRLQQTKGLTATGGSATTIVDTTLSTSYQDDDLIGFTAFVTYDAGGAGADPEGKYSKVSDYVASTTTLTIGTVTTAIAAGDEITLARGSLFPLADVKRICNNALRSLGEVINIDETTTTAASQTEYDVPTGVNYRSIVDVKYQRNTGDSDDNEYESIPYRIVPDASIGGGDALIVVDQLDSGRTLQVWSLQPHTVVRVYDSNISLDIHPELAIAKCALECARWKVDKGIERSLLNDLEQDFLYALRVHPIKKYVNKVHGFPQWSNDGSYIGDQSFYDRVN